jgi:hypothetical protein
MWGKLSASYDEITKNALDSKIEDAAIRNLAAKVNKALRGLGVPYQLTSNDRARRLAWHLPAPVDG